LAYETDLPISDIAEDEVLVRVKAAGICGSDLHCIEADTEGYTLFPGHGRMNIVLGHEFSGIVEKVGVSVRRFKAGDTVVGEEMGACGRCPNCKNGFPNQCESLEEAGLTYNGGFADYSVVKEHHLWSIDGLAEKFGDRMFVAGALIEPLSVVYNGLFSHPQITRPGSYAIVYGCGPIGLMAISLLKICGAARVIATDMVKERLDLALQSGADFTFCPDEMKTAPVTKLFGERGADVLVEASGAAHAILPDMLKRLACNAHIVVIGMGAREAGFSFGTMQQKHVAITGSVGSSGHGNYENIIRLLASGAIDITPFVSQEFSLEEYQEAFKVAKDSKSAKILFLL
jgi:threonine dehydrogenase-like Zn-dependent dehydrogenase